MTKTKIISCFIATLCILLTGCDGGAFPDVDIIVQASDTPGTSGDGSDGGTGGGGTPTLPNNPVIPNTGGDTPTETGPFEGTWFVAFGDDFADTSLIQGFTEYAARMTLTDNTDGTISGTGTMFRTFFAVPNALQEVTFTIDGFKRGENDAELTFTANSAADFELEPVWQLRVARNRLVGIYSEILPTTDIGRTGHAVWYKVSAAPALSTRWASSWEDAFGTDALPRRERFADVTLSRSQSNDLTGTGQLVEVRPLDVVEQFTFNVTRGTVSGNFMDPTFGSLDLAGNEYDWVGFFNGARFAGAYAQRGAGGVVRWGHAEWTPSTDVDPGDLVGEWVASFSDSNAVNTSTPRDYLVSMTLTASGGNTIGAASVGVFDQHATNPVNSAYDFSNGQLIGNRFTFRFTRNQRQFDWDCHVTGDRIYGIYKVTNTDTNAFVSRGHAEWQKRSTGTSVEGGWTSSYVDTINTTGRRQTQYIRFTITEQTSSGDLTGTGFLRFAGESGDRTFALTGDASRRLVTIILSGAGLSGDIELKLRLVADGLYAVYENRDTADERESRGAPFLRRTATN